MYVFAFLTYVIRAFCILSMLGSTAFIMAIPTPKNAFFSIVKLSSDLFIAAVVFLSNTIPKLSASFPIFLNQALPFFNIGISSAPRLPSNVIIIAIFSVSFIPFLPIKSDISKRT